MKNSEKMFGYHNIQCACGCVKGVVTKSGSHNRVICYCSDCQAFAQFLKCESQILNTQGGTEIVQIAQYRLHFSQGKDYISAMQLSEKGMVRWFTSCCHTPIGNTLQNSKIPFIGLIHSILDEPKISVDFGKHISAIHVQSALGEPKPKQSGLVMSILFFFKIIIFSLIDKKYKESPFYEQNGEPITKPNLYRNTDR